MKYINAFAACIIISCIMISSACTKDMPTTTPLASLRIINTVTGGSTLRLGSVTGSGTTVSNNSSLSFPFLPGNSIYIFPVGDSLKPYYTAGKEVLIREREVYSLFLGGTPSSIASLLIKEDFPQRNDSTAGIRFVNLSPNSPPVNVTLSTTPTVSEFFNIGYQEITDFKAFPATSVNTSYTFQVRNANTGATITSITMSGTTPAIFVPRFKNSTLVLRGLTTGTPAAGITRVNHY